MLTPEREQEIRNYAAPADDLDPAAEFYAEMLRDLLVEVKELREAGENASSLVGYALFNLTKGNIVGTKNILLKVFKILTGTEWDGKENNGEADSG